MSSHLAIWIIAALAVAGVIIRPFKTIEGAWATGALQNSHIAEKVTRAILIGVDLGPNLSVTGSLATILWLNALRREQQRVGAGRFLKLGMILMPPALPISIAAALL